MPDCELVGVKVRPPSPLHRWWRWCAWEPGPGPLGNAGRSLGTPLGPPGASCWGVPSPGFAREPAITVGGGVGFRSLKSTSCALRLCVSGLHDPSDHMALSLTHYAPHTEFWTVPWTPTPVASGPLHLRLLLPGVLFPKLPSGPAHLLQISGQWDHPPSPGPISPLPRSIFLQSTYPPPSILSTYFLVLSPTPTGNPLYEDRFFYSFTAISQGPEHIVGVQ